ncbi:MAG: heat-inducible transcriptional repressor HrcA [Gemmatimonadota bacterium]|jgi:heat-inducible transcriptional repressor|nr:heat-inducible transcriptional repressor HrcA [Gemmatimonadota bacterium]
MPATELNERERRVLDAVIQTYIETAEPAGSRTISRRFGLGVSPATIRNTMSDLEEKGFLFQPHTSGGRIPTERAYRAYVDAITDVAPSAREVATLAQTVAGGDQGTVEGILRRAAQTLGVLTQELGVALGPRFDGAVLKRLELLKLSSERLLMALTLGAGAVRTIFVEVEGPLADRAIQAVERVLNERLAGLSLREIRTTLGARLRDALPSGEHDRLLNIFVEEGEQLFDRAARDDDEVVLGQASVLADQPEFASGEGLKRVIALTETRARLADALRGRASGSGITITIGTEHGEPVLQPFTVVTAAYRSGPVSGVIGVIGPTRMPYDKVIALVRHTSQLVTDLIQ